MGLAFIISEYEPGNSLSEMIKESGRELRVESRSARDIEELIESSTPVVFPTVCKMLISGDFWSPIFHKSKRVCKPRGNSRLHHGEFRKDFAF